MNMCQLGPASGRRPLSPWPRTSMARTWRCSSLAMRGARPSHMRPWSQPPWMRRMGGSCGLPHAHVRMVVRPRSTRSARSGCGRSSTFAGATT
jgi:hypothetical protein